MWSLNVSHNHFFMKGNKITLRPGLCNGFFWGCIVRKKPSLELRHGDGHEDVERTVRYLDSDGAVLRYREFCAKTRCKTNRGGLQASLSKQMRKAEEQRSVDLLIQHFPLFVSAKPGSILGLKFLGLQSTVRKLSLISSAQFKKCAALKNFSVLQGSLFVCICRNMVCHSQSFTHVHGKIDFINADLGMLGLTTSDDRRLLASSWDFHDAIMKHQIFVVWVPPEARKAFGMPANSDDEAAKLPPQIRELCNTTGRAPHTCEPDASCAASGGPLDDCSSAVSANTDKAPLSDFARYLHALTCDDSSSDEEEEETDKGGDTDSIDKNTGAVKTGPANNMLKGAGRHEDLDWIASQCDLVDVLKGREQMKQLNVLQDWPISCDFETAARERNCAGLVAATPADSSALAQHASVNSLFCAARIWGGGWGGTCTHSRLPDDEYCSLHRKELQRQEYLTHGRSDGPVPPKKRAEMEKWQKKMREKEAPAASSGSRPTAQLLTDSEEFSESSWRAMGRGSSESARAFEYRTGRKAEPVAPKKSRREEAASGAETTSGKSKSKPTAKKHTQKSEDGPLDKWMQKKKQKTDA